MPRNRLFSKKDEDYLLSLVEKGTLQMPRKMSAAARRGEKVAERLVAEATKDLRERLRRAEAGLEEERRMRREDEITALYDRVMKWAVPDDAILSCAALVDGTNRVAVITVAELKKLAMAAKYKP